MSQPSEPTVPTSAEVKWATSELEKAISIAVASLGFTRECPGAYGQFTTFYQGFNIPSKLEVEWAQRVLTNLANNIKSITGEVT